MPLLNIGTTRLLRIEYPIIQAGMAEGVTAPRLVAAAPAEIVESMIREAAKLLGGRG